MPYACLRPDQSAQKSSDVATDNRVDAEEIRCCCFDQLVW